MIKKLLSLLIAAGVLFAGIGLTTECTAAPHQDKDSPLHHRLFKKYTKQKPKQKHKNNAVKKKRPAKKFDFFKKKSQKPKVKKHHKKSKFQFKKKKNTTKKKIKFFQKNKKKQIKKHENHQKQIHKTKVKKERKNTHRFRFFRKK